MRRAGELFARGSRAPAVGDAQKVIDNLHRKHLRADEICAELPRRAAIIQSFISLMTAVLAFRRGSIRGLAPAMTGDDEIGLEPTVRRWLGLARGESRPISELNSIVARLAKFSRAETRKLRRRIVRR